MPPWIEVSLRTLVAVGVLFAITKILGKRQISQLSLFEYITGITLGSITAYVSLDLDTNWYLGIVSLVVWGVVSLLIEIAPLKSKVLRDFVEGKGTVLIKDGKVMEDNLKKVRITGDELLQQLRGKDAFAFADVEFAVMESNGKVNVLLKREKQPLTPKDMDMLLGPEQEPQTVIMDGKILAEPLATLGKSQGWLHEELDKLGVPIENVFLGQVDSFGELTVDLFDDQLQVPQPQQRATLLATLKKCEADVEMFALTTDDAISKAVYQECSDSLQQVIYTVRPLLTQ